MLLDKGNADIKTKTLVKNIIYSGGVKVINVCVVYLTIPLLVGYLNASQYGVWLTILTFTSWFTLFDMGLGNGMKNKIVEYLIREDINTAKKYVSTTYITMAVICIAVCLLALISISFIHWESFFNVDVRFIKDVSQATVIILCFTLLTMLLRLSNSLLHAHQLSFGVDFISMLSGAIAFLALLTIKHFFAPSLVIVALAYSISQIILLIIINVILFVRYFKDFRPSYRFFNKSLIRSISSTGGQFFFIQVAALIMYMTDNFVIASLFKPSDVATYNIALKYFGGLTTIWGMVVVPLWPMITKAYQSNEILWINGSVNKLLKMWLLTLIVGFIMLYAAAFVYKIWIGNSIVIPFNINIALLVYTCTGVFATIMATFINGIGKIKLQVYITCFVAVLNVPIAVFFSKGLNWGVVVVPAATTLCLVISSLLAFLQVKKIITGKAKGIWAQ